MLRAPLDVCAARAANRDAHRIDDTAVLEQLWRDFTGLGALERHALDSDGKSAEEIAQEIGRRLRDGSLDV